MYAWDVCKYLPILLRDHSIYLPKTLCFISLLSSSKNMKIRFQEMLFIIRIAMITNLWSNIVLKIFSELQIISKIIFFVVWSGHFVSNLVSHKCFQTIWLNINWLEVIPDKEEPMQRKISKWIKLLLINNLLLY